ncbi:myxovirus resistance protein [Ceratobasidium sp. AG-Ba]|nr:myxovirus resistance protein [Ceratobasidium sp. AG-Ba]
MVEYHDMNNDANGANRRKLLDTLNSLRAMGFSKELELPNMVCVGSQSVGKSSLIEALSGLNLPRQSGTCTRCPIECRLRHTPGVWEARVFLRFDSSSNRRGDTDIPFGETLTDKSAVQDRIARAQKAVLCPDIDSKRFLNEDLEPRGRSFTRDTVVIEVFGKELSDLTFVDLPGLIANSSDSLTENDIQLVEDLVTSYMALPTSLILLVVACESDFETHKSVFLARKYDPTGERTIGVLTKPDRIEPGEEERWLKMIAGQANALKNGWFAVKQPNSKELRSRNYTWERARAKELEYFETTPPWSTISGIHKKHLGTSKLANQLGDVLSIAIQKILPSIRTEIGRLIRDNESQLEKLPKQGEGSPRSIVRELIDKFVAEVMVKLVRGDPLAKKLGLIQMLHASYEILRQELQGASLVFCLKRVGVDDDDEGVKELPRPDFIPEDELWLVSSPCGTEYTLEEVDEMAKWARTREFPDDYPFEVKKELISKVVGAWHQPVRTLVADAEDAFSRILAELVGAHFGMYHHGKLEELVSEITNRLLQTCKDETTTQLDALLEQEAEPYTAHIGQFKTYKAQYLRYYQNLRNVGEAIVDATVDALTDGSVNTMEFGKKVRGSTLQNLNGAHQSALEIMASTRAHYHIAYRRFSDNVPMTIDQYFVRSFGKKIRNALHDEIQPAEGQSDNYFEELLRESDSVSVLRNDLLTKRKLLHAARREVL